MQDYVNADCAECYDFEENAEATDLETLKNHCSTYRSGEVPVDDVYLFMTVDVHLRHIDVRVRAWNHEMTSWGIEYFLYVPIPGRPLLACLNPLMNKIWTTPNGKEIRIEYALIDSGYKPEQVYDFCLQYPTRAFPIKGGSYRDYYNTSVVTAQ